VSAAIFSPRLFIARIVSTVILEFIGRDASFGALRQSTPDL
jgi:hypothetical protein